MLTDTELVCLAVAQTLLGFHSETWWLRYANADLHGMFPYLLQRPGYNKCLRAALRHKYMGRSIPTNRIEPTMTWSIPRITTGAERRLLESMLDRNRAELINTVRSLSEAETRRRLVASPTTPIGLLKHAAVAERIWFQHVLASLPKNQCDGGTTARDASFIVDDNETLPEVIAEFERASERSRVIAADFDLDDTTTHPDLGEVNLRFIYLLLMEDFARHAGHGDILREQIEHPAAPTTDVSEQP